MPSSHSTIVNALIKGTNERWTNYNDVNAGIHYNKPIGTPTVVTYSFSDSVQSFSMPGSMPGYRALTIDERNVVRAAAAAWDRASGLVLIEVPSGEGDMRIGAYNFTGTAQGNSAAYAYGPGFAFGGDIFFDTSNTFPLNFSTSAHEMGHALGLKHSFEPGATGVVLPKDEDNTDLTLMSYTRGTVVNPTTLGSYDVTAIQYLYGPDVPVSALYPTGYTAEKYLASNPDLLRAFGVDAGAANYHYLTSGMREGRSASFDGLRYAAGYGDLAQAFGTNETAATSHYLSSGMAEGRDPKAFNPYAYLASYTDLQAAFGTSAQAAELHYLTSGRTEGRSVTFDVYGYLASNADLLTAFKGDTDQGALHYLTSGRAEGRTTTAFNASSYMAANADLAAAFQGDTAAATRHYVTTGWREGRATAPRTTTLPTTRPAALAAIPELQACADPLTMAMATDSAAFQLPELGGADPLTFTASVEPYLGLTGAASTLGLFSSRPDYAALTIGAWSGV